MLKKACQNCPQTAELDNNVMQRWKSAMDGISRFTVRCKINQLKQFKDDFQTVVRRYCVFSALMFTDL